MSNLNECSAATVANVASIYGKLCGLFPIVNGGHYFFVDYDTSKSQLDGELTIDDAHGDLFSCELEDGKDDVESVAEAFLKFCDDMASDRAEHVKDCTGEDIQREILSILMEHSMASQRIIQSAMDEMGLTDKHDSKIIVPKKQSIIA